MILTTPAVTLQRRRLAETYANVTLNNDPTRPLDPLLRMNVDSGGQMLGVVAGWSIDRPSLGYGVLSAGTLLRAQGA